MEEMADIYTAAIRKTQLEGRYAWVDILTVVWSKASPDRIKELEIDHIQLEKWVDIAESLLKCGRNYERSGNVEQVSVFYAIPLAGKKEYWLNGMLKGWDGFSRKANNYIDVPGAHYTLMNHRYVPSFQKYLCTELRRSGI
ncbi:hypothetical protein K7432_011243 [Basidiobolus ranarum]|uniref:Uncharacterized protein n=1 Tax=Basidiobolus ranarum TaxID=34480 RepID=A0ABR2VU80_9FUNG